MAQKKKTTKTKKLHPGGSVPGGSRVGYLEPGVMRGTPLYEKTMRGEPPRGTQRPIARRQEDITAQRRANRRALKLIRQRQRMMNKARRRFGQPTMPTAGISQGRPIRGRTPMPGPAPDSERMKRFQQLMREQQARFNKMQKLRSVTPRPGSIDPKSLPTLDNAMRAAIKAGKFPLSAFNRRKKPSPAQRRSASDARRRNNRPRTT